MPHSLSALLVMDVQPGIVSRLADPQEYVERLRIVMDAARNAGVAVIQVVVGFRAGAPEVSPNNKAFSAIASAPAGMIEPQPVIEPQPGDVVVTKRRVSAFAGSDLEIVLRSKGVTHLVLAGISTSGVVLSTTREAADKDYRLTILKDLCYDMDPEVHRVLTEKIFPRQAEVIASDEWRGTAGVPR